MPTGLTYSSYQSLIVTQIPTFSNDPNFEVYLPNAIDYAELSLYRDLDFLATHGSVALTAAIGNPVITLPSTVIVVEELYYGVSNTPVCPASQPYIRAVYAGAANGPPQYFAIIGAASGGPWTPAEAVLLGPSPDQAYAISAYATQRQAPLSSTNTTTFISTQLPDLFFAASMIYFSGVTKNFGAAGSVDDPAMGITWSKEYERLKSSALVEELRKKFQSQGATARFPTPVTTQAR